MLKNIVKNLEPSSTLRINEISKELEQKGEKIFKFGFGQSPFQVPNDVVSELKNNAYQNKYLSMQGLPELREAIAKFVSLKKISKILGEEIIKADADDVKKNTGFSIGGVPPIAHSNNPKKILIDENLERFETVYAAAGHHSVIFGIHFDQLIILTKGEVSKITED